MIESSDFKALLRLIALVATNDAESAEKALKWAYEGQEKTKRIMSVKMPDNTDAINRIYAIYPSSTTRPGGGRAALKTSKDKERIGKLLLTKTEDDLSNIIKRYLSETNTPYIKMFSTFLNGLPDYDDTTPAPQETRRQEPNNNSIFDEPEMQALVARARKTYE